MKLIIPYITKERAIEIIEDVYGDMCWHNDGGVLRAYPHGDIDPVEIHDDNPTERR